MNNNSKSNYNSKIDPAFSELIKEYLKILTSCCLPANEGYLVPLDHTLDVFARRGYPALGNEYEDITELSKNIKTSFSESGSIKNLSKITRNSPFSFEKELFEPLESLPNGESKCYYASKFAKFQSENINKYFKGMPQDQLIEEIKELYCDWKSLLFHIAIHDLRNERTTRSHKPVKLRKSIEFKFCKNFMASVNDTISMLVNKKHMATLVEEAKKGEDEALFKAVRVDKTLLDAKWVRRKIRIAQYTGEHIFFKQLGDAIKKPPLEHDMEHTQSFLVLAYFWKLGLCRLTNPELMELLLSSGVRVQDDPSTFRKFVDRLKREGVLA